MIDIREVCKHSFKNKESIEKSKACSCYYCLSSFKPEDIKDWTDGGKTAICPFCKVDSVLGDSIMQFDLEHFTKLKKYWF